MGSNIIESRRKIIANSVHLETQSNTVIRVERGEHAVLKECIIDIAPSQSGSGNPSTINVRPIEGYNHIDINVSHTQQASAGNVYSIPWQLSAGVIYGGYIDVLSGELVVTHKKYTFTGGEDWSGNSSLSYAYTTLSDMQIGAWLDDDKALCSHAKKVSKMPSSGDLAIMIGNNNRRAYFYRIPNSLGISTLDAFKAWLSENTVAITYPLDAQLTYQLTPVQIRTLSGVNNIWSSVSGSIRATYWTH